MRLIKIACPACGETHEYLLRYGDEHHLRQCTNCQGWFVLTEAGDEAIIKALGNPATCPVAGCKRIIELDGLPKHIIENHGATLELDSRTE